MARLSTEDKAWIASNFSSLAVIERPKYSLVEGRFYFRGDYDGVTIEDDYMIRLELASSGESLPRLFETDGRLKRVLAAHPEFENKLVELHIYPDERLCVGATQDLRLNFLPNPSAELLFDRYITPYFYSQSYFEQHGKWPWSHLPHDSYGILAWYAENSAIVGAARETAASLRTLATNNINAQHIIDRAMRMDSFSPKSKCLCGSGKKQSQCHRQFMKLALALRQFA